MCSIKNKNAFLFIALVLGVITSRCNNNSSVSNKNNDTVNHINHDKANDDFIKDSSTADLMKFVIEYEPKGIELCDTVKDTLRHYDLKYILSTNNDTVDRKIIYPLLLKQYKCHLLNAHQGYNLLAMRNEPCSIFIDEFIRLDSLQFEHEFLNSGYLYYNILKQKEMRYMLKDTLINRLVKELDIITSKLENKK